MVSENSKRVAEKVLKVGETAEAVLFILMGIGSFALHYLIGQFVGNTFLWVGLLLIATGIASYFLGGFITKTGKKRG